MMTLLIILILYFNSIKVRLIPKEFFVSYYSTVFQFHKGSINTFLPSHFFLALRIFQFHKGSINTRPPTFMLLVFVEFQFHKGSINTYRNNPNQLQRMYFNSIKVRLIHLLQVIITLIFLNFNSIKVRLIPANSLAVSLRLRTFQFHKGSINTRYYYTRYCL